MNSTQLINDKLNSPVRAMRFFEKDTVQEDGSGYCMELHEILLDQINLKWGKYNNPSERVLSFHPEKTTVVSHFRIADPTPVMHEDRQKITENQFVVYYEKPGPYHLYISPTKEQSVCFFEAGIDESLFQALFNEDSNFLSRFSKHIPVKTPSLDFTAFMLPRMHLIINDMYNTPYKGQLKDLYLETKTIELFLLQIEQLDKRNARQQPKLKNHDIERLYEIKRHLEANFDQPTSIAALARKAGINSMKLKTGFKQLFNTTVFGYLNAIRMQEARRLLTEENMYVNEVADRIGYKHPHHFTAAFKKQFNITPRELRK